MPGAEGARAGVSPGPHLITELAERCGISRRAAARTRVLTESGWARTPSLAHVLGVTRHLSPRMFGDGCPASGSLALTNSHQRS